MLGNNMNQAEQSQFEYVISVLKTFYHLKRRVPKHMQAMIRKISEQTDNPIAGQKAKASEAK